ncbi:hypothetical protein HUT18_26190 [Streptomyces sp. NA04227]|uniref:hypothetical protein n=1 Tax=Streptomyces sp. NA04227 TaxID=2742136 RepID=UPI001591310E|nr:hypothetical protein [Streptomyces sp. NA04227]QKW09356.1 hypothetical protein HUT18_26190 [Streptomyces sp. NA04227]
MRYRPLQPGLMVEGNSDEPYLKNLVRRQLSALVLAHSTQSVEVLPCLVSDVRTTQAEEVVLHGAEDLARDCDVLFLHGDADARDRTAKLVTRLGDRAGTLRRTATPVPVVTVLMTESWMLADRTALESVMTGRRIEGYPYARPAAVETRVSVKGARGVSGREKLDPKQVWKALLGDDAHDALSDAAELLVRRTDLSVLDAVPSYRQWSADTEAALRDLGYL